MSKIHSDTSFPMCKYVVEEITQNKYTVRDMNLSLIWLDNM